VRPRANTFSGEGFLHCRPRQERGCGEKGEMNAIFGIVPGVSVLLVQGTSQPGGFTLFLPLILIMAIFYFLMIMPAQRRQKKVAAMLRDLKNGDKVITTGGMYGTIVGLEGDAVQLRVADQVKIKVARSAIAGLQAEQKES
jgi:preprotein translocase subunit YajC